MLVNPLRHATGTHELSAAARACVDGCEQVYVWLWSHAGRTPGHLHFVVQPARTSDIDRHGGAYGPALQAAMFRAGGQPEPAAVEAFCGRVRKMLAEA
ncbi:hypothetical protein ACOBQB_36200 [Streptomyces sp. G5(2025)]|uniref:hypothetical protein n=1 Tax=Streptomyces sp. G5(2025) TaxID=3406628 RepID=UPI003C20CA16